MLKHNAMPTETQAWVNKLKLGKGTPYYGTEQEAAFLADSFDMLKKMPSGTVDLVVTSPSFALLQKKEYGNEPVDRYLEWFMPFCSQIKRVLKASESFVLDIGGCIYLSSIFSVLTTSKSARNPSDVCVA